jgi:L-alanine-DL-glutamate epimerase-like enolase superfamily enzyme
MKVAKIESEIENITLKKPLITAKQRVDAIDFVRVKVICDNGSFTVGEAVGAKDVTGESIKDIQNGISKVKDLLIGNELSDAIVLLQEQKIIGSCTKSALDSAFMILQAQSEVKPLYEYLGAKSLKLIQSAITINMNSKATMLEDIKEAVDKGMFILKLKFSSDVSLSAEIMRSAYRNFPSTMLIADPDQSWSKQDTIRFLELTKHTNIEYLEQPVAAKDISSLKEITTLSNVTIVADESVSNLDDMKKIIETKSADMINLKLMKCGGVSKAIEILEYARANGIKCVLGSMLEGPFSINAALHLAIAYSDVIKYVDLDSPLLYDDLYDELEFSYSGSRISYKY